jgi:hypothetical protein
VTKAGQAGVRDWLGIDLADPQPPPSNLRTGILYGRD